MSMMLGDMAVTTVVKHINDQYICSCCRERKAIVAYKYEKPLNLDGEYIAVNHLPFVHRNVVGEGVVNVNIHVPKMKNGLPNTKRLASLTEMVVSLFPEGTYLDRAYFEFLSDSRPTPDNDDTYYVNIQLNVIFNNLN